MLVRAGFRVIALNNNDCYRYNFWILYSRSEIQGQLQWLHNTLLDAERNHERVHILQHIRSGSGSCFRFWQREYRRIIDRYKKPSHQSFSLFSLPLTLRFHMIIGAQFNGHSHRVEFEVFYDSPLSQHAINVAWNAGSTTAYNNINPNYVAYFVDRTHYVSFVNLLRK